MRFARAIAVLTFALLALALPAAQAGSADDPEVTDPAGDAGPVPTPVAFDWADITALWFEFGDAGVVLTIEVAALSGDPPGEVGAHFRVGDKWWITGWTTVAFPAPPFTYAGGFFCPAEQDGNVPDPSLCGSVDAIIDGNHFVATLPSATFGFGPGLAIDEPRGYAVDLVSAQPEVQAGWIEVTDPGRPFTIPASPDVSDAPGSPGTSGVPEGDDADVPGSDATPGESADDRGDERGRDAPALPLAVLLAALAVAAVTARRFP